jgi:hypothetical protein
MDGWASERIMDPEYRGLRFGAAPCCCLGNETLNPACVAASPLPPPPPVRPSFVEIMRELERMRARAAEGGSGLPPEPTTPQSGDHHCLVLGPAAVAAATGIAAPLGGGVHAAAWPAGQGLGPEAVEALGPSAHWGLPSIEDEGEEALSHDATASPPPRGGSGPSGGGGPSTLSGGVAPRGSMEGVHSLIGSQSVYVEEEALTTTLGSTAGHFGTGAP